MIKSYFVFTCLAAFFFLFSIDASAQKKQRVVLKKRVTKVTGIIQGEQIREYVFRVRKNTDIDISVVHNYFEEPVKPHPKFVVFLPGGKPLHEDQEPGTDLLEVLEIAGDYTVRLQLPEDMRNDGKPVKFTLQFTVK